MNYLELLERDSKVYVIKIEEGIIGKTVALEVLRIDVPKIDMKIYPALLKESRLPNWVVNNFDKSCNYDLRSITLDVEELEKDKKLTKNKLLMDLLDNYSPKLLQQNLEQLFIRMENNNELAEEVYELGKELLKLDKEGAKIATHYTNKKLIDDIYRKEYMEEKI